MISFVVGIYMRAGMRSIIIWVVVVFVVMFVVLFATPRISFPASKHLSFCSLFAENFTPTAHNESCAQDLRDRVA